MKVRVSKLASATLFLFWFSWTYAQVAWAGSVLENIIPFFALGMAVVLMLMRGPRVTPRLPLLPFLIYFYILIDFSFRGAGNPGVAPIVMTIVVMAASYLLIVRASGAEGLALGLGFGLILAVLLDPSMASQLSSAHADVKSRFGGNLQVNAFAALVSVAAITNAFVIAFWKGWRRHFALGNVLFCCILSFLFVGSRQALFAVTVVSLSLVAYALVSPLVKRKYKLSIIMVALFIGYKLLTMMLQSEFGYRFLAAFNWISGSARVADHSLDDRQQLLDSAWRTFSDAPILGHGLWGFGTHTGLGAYAHNNFAEVSVDHGIIGLLIFVLPYVFIIRTALRAPKAKRLILFGGTIAALIIEMANVTIGKAFFPPALVVASWYCLCALNKADDHTVSRQKGISTAK
jgi:O-antigen ligase